MASQREISAMFNQPDEEEDGRSRFEHTNQKLEENAYVANKQKSYPRIKLISRRSISEDSGVKSNEEDDYSRPLPVRKKSRVSIQSIPSSPAFEISTFDELFQNGGHTRIYLQRLPTLFRQQSTRRPSAIELPLEEQSEPDTETKKTPAVDDPSKELKRQDSIMSQSLKSLIHSSWQGAKGFQDFRNRMGSAVHHKYCMCLCMHDITVCMEIGSENSNFSLTPDRVIHQYTRSEISLSRTPRACLKPPDATTGCRIESTFFIFLYVVFGIFLVCAGIMCSMDCQNEVIVTAYLITDGLLSVFLFPILLLGWTKHVGGCVVQREKIKAGVYWIGTLILRVLFAGAGTFIAIHRYTQGTPWENSICYIEFLFLISALLFEWCFLFFVILLPFCVCGVTFLFASSRKSVIDL